MRSDTISLILLKLDILSDPILSVLRLISYISFEETIINPDVKESTDGYKIIYS